MGLGGNDSVADRFASGTSCAFDSMQTWMILIASLCRSEAAGCGKTSESSVGGVALCACRCGSAPVCLHSCENAVWNAGFVIASGCVLANVSRCVLRFARSRPRLDADESPISAVLSAKRAFCCCLRWMPLTPTLRISQMKLEVYSYTNVIAPLLTKNFQSLLVNHTLLVIKVFAVSYHSQPAHPSSGLQSTGMPVIKQKSNALANALQEINPVKYSLMLYKK